MSLGRFTSPEVEATKLDTLVVPLGATEQHGPHLPLDTDTVIASAWSAALAERLDRAVVAPALPFGSSGEHQSFPGTLSIGQDAFRSVIVELARSARHRFDRVVFVSGHAGNAAPLLSALEQLRQEGHDVVGLLPFLDGADAHAGQTETSLMLYLDPDAVRQDRLEPGNSEPLSELIDELRRGGVAAVAPNGVLGDPRKGTEAEGRDLFSQLQARGSEIEQHRPGTDC